MGADSEAAVEGIDMREELGEEEDKGALSNMLPESLERPRTIGLEKPCWSHGGCSVSSFRACSPSDPTSDDSSMLDRADSSNGDKD